MREIRKKFAFFRERQKFITKIEKKISSISNDEKKNW